MLEDNNKKYNLLSKLNRQNSESKIKKLFPNIHLVKSRNNSNNKIKLDKESNTNNNSQIKFKSYNDLNKISNVNCKIKKQNQSSRHSTRSILSNKDFKLNSNKKDYNNNRNEYIKSGKTKLYDNIIINDNNQNNDLNNEKKIASHNIIISDLLLKTENFFNDLGLYLEENNIKNIEKKNNKISNRIGFNGAIGFNKPQNNINIKGKKMNIRINKNIFNFENNNKNDIMENKITNKYKNVLENYNNLNNKSIGIKKNKSFNNSIRKNEINNIENNSNIIKKNIKVYYKKSKNKKMVSDEIIQTFNFEGNDGNDETKTKLEKNKNNNILPNISQSQSIEKIEQNKNDKNGIKIAEIRPVYPVYPYNRIVNLIPSNNSKYNYNIHKKIILDMKDNFSHDNRYNYEQLMNKIKYGIKSRKESPAVGYNFLPNANNKKIVNNWKKVSKKNEIFI